MPEHIGEAWCGPHNMHPKDCFELHHPEAFPTPDDLDVIIVERLMLVLPCDHLVERNTIMWKGNKVECECGRLFRIEKSAGSSAAWREVGYE